MRKDRRSDTKELAEDLATFNKIGLSVTGVRIDRVAKASLLTAVIASKGCGLTLQQFLEFAVELWDSRDAAELAESCTDRSQ